MQNNYIKKLKDEKEKFVEEALKSERDLNELLENRDHSIKSLKCELELLKIHPPFKLTATTSVDTQTEEQKTIITDLPPKKKN
ncbi:hypothetical protein JTB14_000889 [Gonioctena quinquepunctata]|nr:hypothetical protein JTB14_000889 [Gonioctena quinquepunctata]